MFRRPTRSSLLLLVLASSIWVHAQFEVPEEARQRTILIRSGKEQATAFKLDEGGRIYLVTTRHFGKNLALDQAVVEVWHNQSWNELQTVRTIFPTSKDVDLAILETDERIAKPYAVVKSSEVLTTGQRVWFIGAAIPIHFPPDAPKKTRIMLENMSSVNTGTIAAINPTQPDAFEIHFQGKYNLDIAAGPIVYWSPSHRDYEILGFVRRNESHAARVPANAKFPQATSAILEGYSIDVVVEAISGNPHS
jgi:hypothetical protein